MADQKGQFFWYELMTDDTERAKAFYGHVLGWTVVDGSQPGMQYWMWSTGNAMVGGLMAIPADAASGGMRPGWLGYVTVPDVDASLAAITQAGGIVHMPATDIPNVGRIGLFADPQGATIYAMTSAGDGESQAFDPAKSGHGAWNELHTTDWQAASAFYEAQFGWSKSDAIDMGPGGTYQLFNAGTRDIGGMMNDTAEPPHWLTYFGVDAIAAAIARVTEAGGTITAGPHQVPGGSWIAHATDAAGARFGLTSAKP